MTSGGFALTEAGGAALGFGFVGGATATFGFALGLAEGVAETTGEGDEDTAGGAADVATTTGVDAGGEGGEGTGFRSFVWIHA